MVYQQTFPVTGPQSAPYYIDRRKRKPMYDRVDSIIALLPQRLRKAMLELPANTLQSIREIRLRSHRFAMLDCANQTIFIEECGVISPSDIAAIMSLISDFSVNSIKSELARGFVTLENAVRVGVVGEAVVKNGVIEVQKNISGINFRIPHECIGCAKEVFSDIFTGRKVRNTLLVSPPMMGKTTMLRDIARLLGDVMNVAIIDERSEIAATSHGIAQMDVGRRTDVLDCCPKPEGISMAIRSMSPSVIITDEIGPQEDGFALCDAARSGVSFVATMHGANLADAKRRSCSKMLFDEGLIERVILLGNSRGVGTVEQILRLT